MKDIPVSLSPVDFIAASFAEGKAPDLDNCGWSSNAVFETLQCIQKIGAPWGELIAKRITELSGNTVRVTIDTDTRGPFRGRSIVLKAEYPERTRRINIGGGMNSVIFLD